jgi:(p)ppGpp synthase/HD superfamily hydrolase
VKEKIEKLKYLKSLAKHIVMTAFDGVLDKGGKPYIQHCEIIGITSYLDAYHEYIFYKDLEKAEYEAIEIGIAGYLHDIVEDTCIGIDVIELLFGAKIARLVDLVTKKESESYMQFIDRVKTCPKATIIKRCDIRHNMDLTRLETITDADLTRIKKYEKALKRLG